MADKITPDDARMVRKTVPNIRGKTYHYLLFTPSSRGPPADTVILIHGFPDLSLGWRYQIPALLALNLRVVVPDTLGYGRTDAPPDVSHYSLKNLADDIVALAAAVVGPDVPFIVGGHDWGAGLAWRVALWRPDLVRAIFCFCVSYTPPREGRPPLEDIVRAGAMPNFGYQLQLIGPDVEREVRGKDKVRQLLSAFYGGRDARGKAAFTVKHGIHFDRLGSVGPPGNITAEEMEYYVQEYSRSGLRGPLNWYRTGRLNTEDELVLARKGKDALRLRMPALFISATRDAALPPSLGAGMGEWIDDLTTAEVDATHWLLWEKPEEVNRRLKAWLEKSVFGRQRASL